jgi:hypothetical protein
MSLPCPRFTVRRLMVVVAIVGFAFWVTLGLHYAWRFMKNPYFDDPRYIRLMRETAYRRNMAEKHSKMAARSVGKQAVFPATMEAKWKEAADNPGRHVEPDPPEPE